MNQNYSKSQIKRINEQMNNTMFSVLHQSGVTIQFNNWDEYNKFCIYNTKTIKKYTNNAYEEGVKAGIEKGKEEQMKETYTYLHKSGVTIQFKNWDEYNKFQIYSYNNPSYDDNYWQNYANAAYSEGYAAAMEKVSKGQDKPKEDKSQSSMELVEPMEVKVKVNNVDEFIKIWDVLYPKK